MTRVLWGRSPILSICTGLALGLAGCGGSSTPPQISSSLGSAVDGVVNAALQQQSIPGIAVALAKNGTILYAQAYGFSNLATHQPAQTNTIFEIGSITKQFTAALIMKLQEQGKLHVDDSINLYLPEYGFPPSITLRMLLTHTSGLWNYTSLPQYQSWAVNGVSEATVLTAVSQAPLEFKPGTSYSYSNSNFFALGAIIEKVTGKSYEANLQQYIFQPLGLVNTDYSLPPATQSAVGYINSGVPAIVVDRSAPFAAGALSSNVSDLVAWDYALINGKVVSADSFKAMTTSNGFTIPGGGSYGFGLGLDTFNNRNIIVHGGAINGFTADNVVFLDNGFTVVVLTNDDYGNPGALVNNILNAVCNSNQLSGNC
jgi:CubicO group peptidase (beta-lactamase class C family)